MDLLSAFRITGVCDRDVTIHTYPGPAVVTGLSERKTMSGGGEEQVRLVRFTCVYEKPRDRWQEVAEHDTAVDAH